MRESLSAVVTASETGALVVTASENRCATCSMQRKLFKDQSIISKCVQNNDQRKRAAGRVDQRDWAVWDASDHRTTRCRTWMDVLYMLEVNI